MTTSPTSSPALVPAATRAVHIYATMRLRVLVDDAMSDADAIAKAESRTDLHFALRDGEFAEEISGFLVDELDGSGDIVSDVFYDRDGNKVPPGLDPVAMMPAMTAVVARLSVGDLPFVEARAAARAALQGVDLPASRPAGIEEHVVAVVSTAHVTRNDSDLLDGFTVAGHSVTVVNTGYGSMVSLEQGMSQEELDVEKAALAEEGYSEAFIALWESFRAKGYHWLNLDRDGDVVDGFATHSW